MIDEQLVKTFGVLAEAGHDFECKKGVLQVVASNAVAAAGTAWLHKRLDRVGVETSFFDREAAQNRVGSAPRAVLNLPAYTVQPFKLAQGPRRLLLSRGVSVFEGTAVYDSTVTEAAFRRADLAIQSRPKKQLLRL